MRKLTADDPESKSVDLIAENIERLKELFPEAFTEGKIDFEVLKQLLGGSIDESEEKYGLNWHGKRQARRMALTPSTGTLRPCPEESVDWDKTQHLMIEGDNLEVLKLLQKSYAGKVKLIYIDPPYNTGKDFIYPDDYRDNIKNYLERTGQTDGEGRKNVSNPESSGRFHTDWLNMMYPRMKLARQFLSENGVIFVSISDQECYNLRIILNEVFGDENFIASVIWQKVYSPKNSARHFSEDHDYIYVYAKNAEIWKPYLLPRTEEMESRYVNIDNDSRGPWKPGDMSARNYYSEGVYSITCPSGRKIENPPSGRYWVVSKDKFEFLNNDNRIWWGVDGNNIPSVKRFLSEVQPGRVPQTLWFYDDVGHTQEAKKELIKNIEFPDSDSVFETPKPTRLIQRIMELSTRSDDDSIVLDFFAGSGSTLHAVMSQNAMDGGNRRCFLIQLPEPLKNYKEGSLSTIADITKERVRKAGSNILKENSMFAGDIGFRVFKLASTNIREWDPERDKITQTLLESVDHLKSDRTDQDILFEIILKLGLDLSLSTEQKTIAGKVVHAIGSGALFVCLEKRIELDEVSDLGHGIAEWHKMLAPAGATHIVFRDSAFADDSAKANISAILKQHGIENVRSI
jgi:adenine-specific DNA-methyltransferase